MISYVLLAIIHDAQSTEAIDERIYFDLRGDSDKTWADRWAGVEWLTISDLSRKMKSIITVALRNVKADLVAGTPTHISTHQVNKDMSQQLEDIQDGLSRVEDTVSKNTELKAPKMSKPLSLKKWSEIFGISQSTMIRWKNEKKYPFNQISPKKWELPIDSLPCEYLEKYRPLLI